METHIVTLTGSGQLNGVVLIKKAFETDHRTATSFVGAKRNDVIIAFLQTHYPGVKINPGNIRVDVEQKKVEQKKSKPLINNTTSTSDAALAIGLSTLTYNDEEEEKENEDISFANSLKHLIEYSFNGDEDDTKMKLDSISLQTTGYKWDIKESKIVKENNRALTQCLKQFQIGLAYLETQTKDEKIIQHYKKELTWLMLKRFFNYS